MSDDENFEEDDFLSINTTNTKLKVGNTLKPYTFYEFKVLAVNLLGQSKETSLIRVRTAATSMSCFFSLKFFTTIIKYTLQILC